MRTRSAARLAALIEAGGEPCTLIGDGSVPVGPDVVIDSRQVGPGALFIALPGEHADGHDFLDAAASSGAGAAIVSHRTEAPLAQLVCADAQQGLTALARSLHAEARAAGLKTAAITGSAGKTSTKDLLAQILAAAGPTVSPIGSLNNEIGNPLTVCQIDEQTDYLVSEMGARAVGDVAHLCSIVHPDASIVLNIGTAHLGEFGSRQKIAEAKGEIVEALDADGWAVLNADDALVDAMSARTGAHIARFSVGGTDPLSAELIVRADDLAPDDLDRFGFTLTVSRPASGLPATSAQVRLRVIGEHQVADATAAAAAALALGVDLQTVATALCQATARSPWRMELHELANGAAIINDAYNANPESMAAALHAVAAIGGRRRAANPDARTIAVVGDMLELGETSAQHHAGIGRLAAELGFDEIVALGEHAGDLVAGATRAGGNARISDPQSAAGSLSLQPGDVVLVKASRGLRLEEVADQLVGGEESR